MTSSLYGALGPGPVLGSAVFIPVGVSGCAAEASRAGVGAAVCHAPGSRFVSVEWESPVYTSTHQEKGSGEERRPSFLDSLLNLRLLGEFWKTYLS